MGSAGDERRPSTVCDPQSRSADRRSLSTSCHLGRQRLPHCSKLASAPVEVGFEIHNVLQNRYADKPPSATGPLDSPDDASAGQCHRRDAHA